MNIHANMIEEYPEKFESMSQSLLRFHTILAHTQSLRKERKCKRLLRSFRKKETPWALL